MWLLFNWVTFVMFSIRCISSQHIIPHESLQTIFRCLDNERDFQCLMMTTKQLRRLGREIDPIFDAHSRLNRHCDTSYTRDILSQLYWNDGKTGVADLQSEINHQKVTPSVMIDLSVLSNECLQTMSELCMLHKRLSPNVSRYSQYQLSPLRVRSPCFHGVDCPVALLKACPVDLELQPHRYWHSLDELITKHDVDIHSITVMPANDINRTATVVELARLVQVPRGNITSLDLKFNALGDEAISLLTSLLAGKTNKLQLLNLDGNSLSTGGMHSLAQMFTSPYCLIKYLSLACNIISPDSGFLAFAETLCTYENHLLYLDLEHNEIGDVGVRYLTRALSSPLTRLRVLVLGNNFISDIGSLNLYLGLMSPYCQLTTLDLNENLMTAQGLYPLGRALRRESSTIRELDISGNAIQLHDSTGFEYFVKCLSESRLEHLDMQATGLTNANVVVLSEHLKHPANRIKTLIISNNAIGNRGIRAISNALKHSNNKIRHLELQLNRIGYVGYRALSAALASPNCKVEYLNLASTGMKSKSAFVVVQGLMQSRRMKYVGLAANTIGNKGAQAFMNLFKTLSQRNDSALQWIDLRYKSTITRC